LDTENSAPKCFVSYSHGSQDHDNWVLTIASKLRNNGVNVILDQWDLRLGSDVMHFMESSVRESERVVIICTPKYAEKANSGMGGAGYEKMIVTGEIYHHQQSTKFIPLLRRGSKDSGLPTYLKSKNYIDFTDDSKFATKFDELLRDILNVPLRPKPKLGVSKFAMSEKKAETPMSDEVITYCSRCGVLPATQSICIGMYTQHDFVYDQGVIFCNRCGQFVGRKTMCIGMYSLHDFRSGNGSEFCNRCGIAIGQRSTCTGMYTHHNFVSKPAGKVEFRFSDQ